MITESRIDTQLRQIAWHSASDALWQSQHVLQKALVRDERLALAGPPATRNFHAQRHYWLGEVLCATGDVRLSPRKHTATLPETVAARLTAAALVQKLLELLMAWRWDGPCSADVMPLLCQLRALGAP